MDKIKRGEYIAKVLCKCDEDYHAKGETLSTFTRVLGEESVVLLKSGTPLNCLELKAKEAYSF